MKPSETRRKALSILLSTISVIVLASAGVTIFSHPGLVKASSTLTFAPVADSYVNQSDPTHNFGSNNSINVDGSPLVRAYLRFDVSGIGGSPVTKVTFRIYANSSSGASFTVKRVEDNNWQENGINYNNAPTPGNLVGTSNGFSANVWVSTDVTPLLNADGTVSIVLVGIDPQAINLAARENDSHAPQLLVEVSSPGNPTAIRSTTPSITATRILATSATATRTFLPIVTITNPPEPTATPPGESQPGFPIRAVFYYPWFPEAWNQQGYNPFTNYTPSLGLYDSSSVSVIQAHISAMTYGNINAAILSWWGQGSNTDQRVATILGATPGSSNPNFRWSIYYENESQGDPTVAQIQNDLQYIQSHYGNNPSFLRVYGKFVVFVYDDAADACGMAERWVQADDGLGHPAYIVLKVFAGFRTCTSQPDSWHQYSPAVAMDRQSGYSYAISPGFWKKGEAVRLARNLTTWNSNVRTMVAAGDPWQLITTFSEWGEGTSVESAVEWASSSGYGQYMDVLHTNGNGNPPSPVVTAQFTDTLAASPTPVEISTFPPNPSPTPTLTATVPPNPSPTPTLTTTIPPNQSPTPTLTTTVPPNPSPIPTLTATVPPNPSPTPTLTATVPPRPSSAPTLTATVPPNPSPTPTLTATIPPNPSPTPTHTATPAPGNDPILFYVSDLVSSGSLSRAQTVVNLIQNLMSLQPDTEMLVASGGDNEQESSPTISNYQSYFGTTFGNFVSQGIFMQVRGNHDIQSAGSYTNFDGTVHNTGAAYWDYFSANAHMFNIEGKKLTDYSYDLGIWHIIGLDQLNGNVSQPTLDFLTSDLAAHASSICQLVYWHVPTYSSGGAIGDSTGLKPLNQAEFNAGVDIQLNGHDHDYQRFYPINPNGVRDDAHGITTFVAGIGGEDGYSGSQNSHAQAASAVYLDRFPPGTSHAIGVIQFTLHASSADYILYDANNSAVLDQGTVVCH